MQRKFAKMELEGLVELNFTDTFTTPTGRTLPVDFLEGLTEYEVRAFGLYEIQEPPTPQAGYVISTTNSLKFVGEKVHRVYETIEKPLATIAADLCRAIDNRRDTLIDEGFTWGEYTYQSRPSDRENISGCAQAAFMAKASGAQTGDFHWHGDPENPFVWITASNALVPMDVDLCIGLFQRGIAFKSALTFYARAFKDWVNDEARTRSELTSASVLTGLPSFGPWPT